VWRADEFAVRDHLEVGRELYNYPYLYIYTSKYIYVYTNKYISISGSPLTLTQTYV